MVSILPLHINSQNLIPNPSFEDHSECIDPPPNQSLQTCNNWFNAVEPLSTVDWYSTCFPTSSFYQLPDLFFGYSLPHSGDAMIGIGPYSTITDIGECFGVRLINPLVADSSYCLNFWLKNSRNHEYNYSMYSINSTFVYDTSGINSRHDITDYLTLLNTPDNGEWIQLSSYYVANGGEEFLLVGLFQPLSQFFTEVPQTSPETRMYYYLDDFSLTQCNKDSLFSVVLELPNVFSPNGSDPNDFYILKIKNIKSLIVSVLNRWGNVVKEYNGLTEIWDGTDMFGNHLSEGVYFIKVNAESNFGDYINKQQCVQLIR